MNINYTFADPVRRYSDIDMNFEAHPVTGDIIKVVDEASIKQALKNIVLLNFYEKPFHPEIGTGIYGSLFELVGNKADAIILQEKILGAIEAYEPRADSLGVTVEHLDSDPNSLYVSIYFTPINAIEPVRFEFFLSPVR